MLGKTSLRRFRWIEARKMLANDLVSLIAIDPLGTRIPSHDVTGRIEHEEAASISECDTVTSRVFGEDFAGSKVAEPFSGTVIQ